MKTFLRFVALVSLVVIPEARAQFANNPSSDLVLGAVDLNTPGTQANDATGFSVPRGIAFHAASGKLFVVDSVKNRVLRFGNLGALMNGAAAEMVVGQPNFTNTGAGLTNATLDGPVGIHVDASGSLWVADQNNHRVMRFPNATTSGSNPIADLVLGQANFNVKVSGNAANQMTFPTGVTIDGAGNLWVADSGNHRVIRFASAASLSIGASASSVLGQPGFGTGLSSNLANRLNNPESIVASPSGTLWVTDTFNHRVLRFDAAATLPDGSFPNATLGQAAAGENSSGLDRTSFNTPRSLALSGAGALYVADGDNRRVLLFRNAASRATGAAADAVIGQPDFTTNSTGTSPLNFSGTTIGLSLDGSGNLWVSDLGNFRVVRFPPDLVLPVLRVTTRVKPASPASSLRLRGTASDVNGISKVEFRTGKRPFRLATGTTTWRAKAALKFGKNQVQVKATDGAANASLVKTLRTTRLR